MEKKKKTGNLELLSILQIIKSKLSILFFHTYLCQQNFAFIPPSLFQIVNCLVISLWLIYDLCPNKST